MLILGPCRSGKTTYAKRVGAESGVVVTHLDDFADMGWSAASQAAAALLAEPSLEYIMEGVAGARALRKLLAAGNTPDFDVVRMSDSKVPLSRGQRSMNAGELTVWREVYPELARLGVDVCFDPFVG